MRKILLIICIAFVVLCYGYPCFILPFGEYSHKETSEVLGADVTVTYSYKFGFDRKATYTSGDTSIEYNYKLKGNKIILSLDEEFGNLDDSEIIISNIYKFGEYINPIGLWSTVGIGILALVLVITIPKRK